MQKRPPSDTAENSEIEIPATKPEGIIQNRADQKNIARKQEGTPARGKTKHLQEVLAKGTYIAFDIETTGGNPEKNGITEIFALRYHEGEIIDTFYSMVNPGVPIPPIVRRMTGINNKMVRDAPPIRAIMPEFIKFIKDDVLVSHNTIGDMKFIRYFALTSCDFEVSNYFLCTHLLVEKLAPNAPDKSLRGLSTFFKLSADAQLHRAEADSYLTLELFKVLLSKLQDKGIKTIQEAIRFQGDFESGTRLGWGIKAEQVRALPESTGVFYLKDFSGQVLFLSSAHNLAREVVRLQRLQSLPKQMLRAVLASSELRFDETPTAFAAALLEAQAMSKHRIRFDPANWHQRTATFIYIYEDNGEFRLTTGPLVAGVVGLLGPIRVARDVTVILDHISRILGRKPSKKGLVVERDEAELIVKFFARRSLKPGIKERLLSLFPRSRTKLRNAKRIRELLSEISIPQDLYGAESCTGVLALAIDERWHLYCVAGGHLQAEFTVQGDLKQGLLNNKLYLRISRQLKKEIRVQRRQDLRLSAADAILLNRMFWWAFFGTRHENVRVFPLQELVNLPLS